jgi:hypothetical protein
MQGQNHMEACCRFSRYFNFGGVGMRNGKWSIKNVKSFLQLRRFGSIMVSRYEAAAVAMHSESPEEATIQILELMLSDEALLACGVGDENKVELDPKILEGVVGTHNVNYYLTCNYTLSRTTSKYHPHKNAENGTSSSSCYHVPFHFLKTLF